MPSVVGPVHYVNYSYQVEQARAHQFPNILLHDLDRLLKLLYMRLKGIIKRVNQSLQAAPVLMMVVFLASSLLASFAWGFFGRSSPGSGLEQASAMASPGSPEPMLPGLPGFASLEALDRPLRIGIQPGHWRIDELPENLARLRTSTGAAGSCHRPGDPVAAQPSWPRPFRLLSGRPACPRITTALRPTCAAISAFHGGDSAMPSLHIPRLYWWRWASWAMRLTASVCATHLNSMPT